MRTIVQPKDFIEKLWGIAKNDKSEPFRPMKYLIRVECEDGTLLHNVATGQLVLLSPEETKAFDSLPAAYSSGLDTLIAGHYIVPESYDECNHVVQERKILRRIGDNKKRRLSCFTILPTTACNARCFYCFEAGIKKETMTEDTADAVIDFIKSHAEGKQVDLRWFGGEPTVGYRIIDRISQGLFDAGVEYSSSMISNGYLFDEDMVNRASSLWKMTNIQVTLDGTEEIYNKTKAYVSVSDSPYQRVIRNIGLLLDKEISVNIRLNLDRYNEQNLRKLISELHTRFRENKYLRIYAWPVFGDCGYDPTRHNNEDNKWIGEKLVEINELATQNGYDTDTEKELPFLHTSCCMADNDATIVIRPGGELVRCLERYEECNVVGNVWEGITNQAIYEDWRTQVVPDMCKDCRYFPRCVYLKHCGTQGLCYKKDSYKSYEDSIFNAYKKEVGLE